MKMDREFYEELLADAAGIARLRAHRNLHQQFSDPVQRTCIALKTGTFIRSHLHPQKNKWELLVVLQGALSALIFDENGVVLERADLASGEMIEIKANTWHTIFPRDGDAVILDVKEGPYRPDDSVKFAAWAPVEGSSSVPEFLRWAGAASCGDVYRAS